MLNAIVDCGRCPYTLDFQVAPVLGLVDSLGGLLVFGLGPLELVVILVVVVIIFGVGRLPELGTGLGEGIKNFKKSMREAKAIDVTPPASANPQSTEEKKQA